MGWLLVGTSSGVRPPAFTSGRVTYGTGASALVVIRSTTFRSTFARMPNIGPLELAILLLIVLVIFGPKRLPGLGRQPGSGMGGLKAWIPGKDKGDDDEPDAVGTPAQRPA